MNQQNFIEEIEKIVGRRISLDENLLASAIDSLALIKLVNLIDFTAKKLSVVVNLDALISEERLSAQLIVQKLFREK